MWECIEEVWLPQCLAIDIDYQTFLVLNPKLVKIHAKAFKLKKEEQISIINLTAWLHGRYVADAISVNFSKDGKYPERPIELTGKNKLSLKEKMEAWAISFNADYERKHPESHEFQ